MSTENLFWVYERVQELAHKHELVSLPSCCSERLFKSSYNITVANTTIATQALIAALRCKAYRDGMLCPAAGTVVVRAVAAARETDPHKRVVITGMGVASVFGNDVEHFYDWCAADLM